MNYFFLFHESSYSCLGYDAPITIILPAHFSTCTVAYVHRLIRWMLITILSSNLSTYNVSESLGWMKLNLHLLCLVLFCIICGKSSSSNEFTHFKLPIFVLYSIFVETLFIFLTHEIRSVFSSGFWLCSITKINLNFCLPRTVGCMCSHVHVHTLLCLSFRPYTLFQWKNKLLAPKVHVT